MRKWLIAAALLAACIRPAAALDRAAVEKLAIGDGEEKIAAIAAIATEGDSRAIPVLQAFANGELQVAGGTAGKRVLIVKGEEALDALTGAKVSPLPAEREDVLVNNRLR